VHFISPRNISFCTRFARANSMYKFEETSSGTHSLTHTRTRAPVFPRLFAECPSVMDEGKQKGRYV